ncbi:hypothetical protein, partial [Salmonella enterica]|uniref:hypothetical protein n=1 Tax=Salmonella enterica TaxID=28901 RepID=UPI003F742916
DDMVGVPVEADGKNQRQPAVQVHQLYIATVADRKVRAGEECGNGPGNPGTQNRVQPFEGRTRRIRRKLRSPLAVVASSCVSTNSSILAADSVSGCVT